MVDTVESDFWPMRVRYVKKIKYRSCEIPEDLARHTQDLAIICRRCWCPLGSARRGPSRTFWSRGVTRRIARARHALIVPRHPRRPQNHLSRFIFGPSMVVVGPLLFSQKQWAKLEEIGGGGMGGTLAARFWGTL